MFQDIRLMVMTSSHLLNFEARSGMLSGGRRVRAEGPEVHLEVLLLILLRIRRLLEDQPGLVGKVLARMLPSTQRAQMHLRWLTFSTENFPTPAWCKRVFRRACLSWKA